MHFRFEKTLPAPIEDVFAFHEDPANLEVLLDAWPGFRMLHHHNSIQPGWEVWFEQTFAYCAPVVMGFRHTLYEPPHRFAEEIIHGPFSRFDHLHEFEKANTGETVVRDQLEIRLPWQYGGAPGVRWIAAPTIRRVFQMRHGRLERLFGDNNGDDTSYSVTGSKRAK